MAHARKDDCPKFCDDILSLPPLGPHDVADRANIDLLLNQLMEQPNWFSSNPYFEEQMQSEYRTLHPHLHLSPAEPCDVLDNLCLDGSTGSAPHNGSSSQEDSLRRVDSSYTSALSSQAADGDSDFLAGASLSSDIAPTDSTPAKTKKYQRLSKEAVDILKSWLHEHRNCPYPSEHEKTELEQQTGLTRTQISNWFTNARRRKTIDITPLPEVNQVDTPFERWKNSPPENEAATTSDIMRALADMPDTFECGSGSMHSVSQREWSSNGSSGACSTTFNASSASSFEHSQASGSERSYSHSQRPPLRSPTPIPNARPRRRYRRHRFSTKTFSKRKAQNGRPFQCTFCADSFTTKYDWQRHEKTLHLPVDQWSCTPQGGIIDIEGTSVCAFCHTSDADDEHLNCHKYSLCREKPTEQRTFSRKDHLKQHLKLIHNVDYHPAMEKWRSRRTYLTSRCGFCDANLESWEERVDHVAEHFKEGADMIQWRGDWGFEPAIQNLVENAMPSYLLGHERHTLDPWKSSDVLGHLEDEEQPFSTNVPNGLDRYTNLQRELVTYIHNQMAEGNHPSDEMIQSTARQIAYGDDDPWNQTYADDPTWLSAIKRDAGLEGSVEPNIRPPEES